MKLNLLNMKKQNININTDCYLYWKCSLYENNCRDISKPVSKFIGMSKDIEIIKNTINLGMHMKSANNTLSIPIITLQNYETKQYEYVCMNIN